MSMLRSLRFASGSGHMKAEVRVNGAGLLWLWKKHGGFLASAHSHVRGPGTHLESCSATTEERAFPNVPLRVGARGEESDLSVFNS